MLKMSLRCTATSMMLCASLSAVAAPASTKPLVIEGVIQEFVGPAVRCPSNFGGTIVGHGISSLAGRVAFIGTDCITQNGPLFNFTEGRMTIVTAESDQIFANYSGQFVPTGQGANFVFSNATFQITGGTGRYKKASGGGSFTGDEDMGTGAGTIKLTGQITFKE